MRLVCPRCGAEYEIDDRLIPSGGREVECSACENSWFQPGRQPAPPPPAAAQAAQAAPRLGRPLAADVMAILRDEAAHFRASHPGIEAAPPPDAAPADAHEAPPAAREVTPRAPAADVALPEARPAEAPAPARDAREVQAAAAVPDSRPPDTAEAAARSPAPSPARPPRTAPAPVRRRGGFAKGFVIGLLIAAAAFGLFVAAPHAGEGVAGDALRAFRTAGEAFHLWVQAQVAALR